MLGQKQSKVQHKLKIFNPFMKLNRKLVILQFKFQAWLILTFNNFRENKCLFIKHHLFYLLSYLFPFHFTKKRLSTETSNPLPQLIFPSLIYFYFYFSKQTLAPSFFFFLLENIIIKVINSIIESVTIIIIIKKIIIVKSRTLRFSISLFFFFRLHGIN